MKYAVMGSPVSHSLSPRIHKAFAAQFGNPHLTYDAIEVEGGTLADALRSFAADGGVGANITSPLKREAFALCGDNVSPRAARAAAVNTLKYDASADTWFGDLTDGFGLVKALTGYYGQDLRDRRTLILGAGGAAFAIVPSLLDAGVGEVIIVNRDITKADKLADMIGQPGRVNTRRIEQLPEVGAFDLVINTISADPIKAFNLTGDLLTARPLIVDLNYGERASVMKAYATVQNAPMFVDGMGMLIEQAAESYSVWHNGDRPDTAPLYAEFAAKY